MNKKYNFSVIIPCYNLGKFLEVAVESVLSQTLENVELIVVDDCSTDKPTIEVLKELEDKVQVIYQEENRGVSVARNVGISASHAKYILCLDADDSVESTYLEKAKNIFDLNEGVGIVTCYLKAYGEYEWVSQPKEGIKIVDALVESPVHTASCFRKTAWKESGGYSEDLRGFEDWDFWIGIIKRGWKVFVVKEVLFNYLTRPDSKVKTSSKNAECLTKVIVNHHKEIFEKYCDEVISRKHAKIEELIKHVNKAKTALKEKKAPSNEKGLWRRTRTFFRT